MDGERVREDHRPPRLHPGGGNGPVAGQQPVQGLAPARSGDQPHNLVGPGQRRVGQRHAPVAPVEAGDGDQPVGNLQDRVAGDQRGGVPVVAQPEVHQVEPGGQPAGVGGGRRLQVRVGDRHGNQAHRQGSQDLAQMGQVALGVPVGRDPLVDLVDLDRAPEQVVFHELGQHEPGGLAAADRAGERAVRRDRGPDPVRHESGRLDRQLGRVRLGDQRVFHAHRESCSCRAPIRASRSCQEAANASAPWRCSSPARDAASMPARRRRR